MSPDRELNAFLAGGEHDRPGFSEAQVEAAAKAMYEQRPQASDPKWWETPWDEVPEAWKVGQCKAARKVLEAARDVGRADQ